VNGVTICADPEVAAKALMGCLELGCALVQLGLPGGDDRRLEHGSRERERVIVLARIQHGLLEEMQCDVDDAPAGVQQKVSINRMACVDS